MLFEKVMTEKITSGNKLDIYKAYSIPVNIDDNGFLGLNMLLSWLIMNHTS